MELIENAIENAIENTIENTIISFVKRTLDKKFDVNDMVDIPGDGIKEQRDMPYKNRSGEELLMDIFEPEISEGTKLPVIINIHGGGLIFGNKNYNVGFCRLLAKRGYLVFSLEYRLIPEVRVYEQLDDVCAGMDCAGDKLRDFNGDADRIYIVAESAGAYLAIYAAAMKHSQVLQKVIGYEPARMDFKAMGLISGMFYTTRKDSPGRLMSRSIYGHDERSKAMSEFTDPENPEIIYNIPPCYLVTSKADMLERYIMDYANVLEDKGVEHYLLHMGDDPKLTHAFPVLQPELPESGQVIDAIVDWFHKH